MPEGGGEVVEEPLQVGVVLLVPLVGVKRPCTSGSTARPNGRRDWSSSALRGTSLGSKKTELGGSMSCRESQWCSRSTRLELGGGVGG
jgi:hypothetical protein